MNSIAKATVAACALLAVAFLAVLTGCASDGRWLWELFGN